MHQNIKNSVCKNTGPPGVFQDHFLQTLYWRKQMSKNVLGKEYKKGKKMLKFVRICWTFSQNLSASSSKFSEAFRSIGIHSHPLGCVWTYLGSFGCFGTLLENSEMFQNSESTKGIPSAGLARPFHCYMLFTRMSSLHIPASIGVALRQKWFHGITHSFIPGLPGVLEVVQTAQNIVLPTRRVSQLQKVFMDDFACPIRFVEAMHEQKFLSRYHRIVDVI